MSQRAIKQRVDKQIEIYRKEAIILDSTTIFDGKISAINVNTGSYTTLTAMTITIGAPPTTDTATATASLSTSITSSFTISTAGAGYNVLPNISFSGGGGTGASATAVLTTGTVTSITLVSGGSGYTSAPTITIALPSVGQETAKGTVVFVSDSSITVTVTNPTTNGYYSSAPVVTASGGVGSGATYTAVLTNGRVTSVTIGGTLVGYLGTNLPTVSFAAPTATTSVATSALTASSISSVSVSNPGWYYTTAPLVSITGGAGSGAFITSTIKDGKVISFNIVSGGTGYTSSPTLTLTAPVNVTATATLTILNNRVSSVSITNAGVGYKTAPSISVASKTGTATIEATFQAVLGSTTYVKKFTWDIEPLSLNECGIMRLLSTNFDPFVVSNASSHPYKISVCDIQTNASHKTIPPSGSPYIPKSGVLQSEFPFHPSTESYPFPLAPQNLNRIVLRIDEEASVDIGIKSTTDFSMLLHILEKEPEFIEYGERNNIQLHQQQPLAAQNYGGNYYGY